MLLHNCKLSYFGIPGRGETIRLALSIGNVKYIDERVPFQDWPKLKSKTPWGSLPILTLQDGKTTIAQQRAILRLVGKETGLYPTDNNIEAAKVDEIMDAVEDFGSTIMKAGVGLPKVEMEAERKKSCQEGGPMYSLLQKLDSNIGLSSASSFAVGDSLTIADLFIFCSANNLVSGLFDGVPKDTLDSFSNIMTLRKAVRSHPGVIKFYDSLDSKLKEKLPASYAQF